MGQSPAPVVLLHALASVGCALTDARRAPGPIVAETDSAIPPDTAPDTADPSTWYADADGDGHGDPARSERSEEPPPRYVADPGDCDDADLSIHPGAPERCNAVDDDCDGEVDEDLASETWYREADGDGYGDPSATAEGCAAPEGYVADATDCDDTDYSVNPGASEVVGNAVDDDCDGVLGHHRLEGSVALMLAEGQVFGETEWGAAGAALATGDLDGDGNDDVAVAAPETYGATGADGTVAVFRGPLLGTHGMSEAVATFDPDEEMYSSGTFLGGGADDVDADGYGDLWIYAPISADYSAYLFRGPLSGAFHPVDAGAKIHDVQPRFSGHTGDLNGDGLGDLLLGSWAYQPVPETGYGDGGSVLLFLAPFSGTRELDAADARMFVRTGCSDASVCGPGVGSSVSTGDLDGDGILDACVGDYLNDRKEARSGLYVVHGEFGGTLMLVDSEEGLLEDADAWLRANDYYRWAGWASSCAGDVNGDGRADVLVGAPAWAVTGEGTASLFYGPVTGILDLAAADFFLQSEPDEDLLGFATGLDSDLDGDGIDEVVVGSGNHSEPRVYVFYGPISGTATGARADARLVADTPSGGEIEVGTGLDADGDGLDDLLVGLPEDSTGGDHAGAAWLFFGGT